MENQLKQVCQFILQAATIQNTISDNRLSYPQVAALMEMVDLKRRGYLDLNDIYELVGKVTETELFAIFKYLDYNRTGEVRVPDLQTALGNSQLTSSNTSKEYIFPRFYKIVDTIKDRPKLIREVMKQYALNANSLKTAYQYICELVKSKYLSQQELITVFKTQFIKNGLKWTLHCEDVIKELLPGQNVSEVKFVDAFTVKNIPDEVEQECLLKGIEEPPAPTTSVKNQSIYSKLKLSGCLSNGQENSQTYSRKFNNFLDSSQVRTPMFNQTKTPAFAEEKQTVSYDTIGRSLGKESPQFKTSFDQIENNITSVLDNIQQRRDKLRQDSLQRKKLIQDVMSRKKQLLVTSDWNEGPTKDQGEREQANSINSVKKVAKSYLNYNPTFYQAQQPTRNREESYPNTPKRQDPVILNNEGSSLSFQRSCGHLKSSVSPSAFTAYEPKRSAQQSEISQILRKYTTNVPEFKSDESTLKSLCKSKSGFMYENPTYSRETSSWRREEQNDSYSYSRGVSSKGRDAYKQNVMKRAEQQAAKKIEEIQRKARMKVLEKKGRREDVEWSRLAKQSINF